MAGAVLQAMRAATAMGSVRMCRSCAMWPLAQALPALGTSPTIVQRFEQDQSAALASANLVPVDRGAPHSIPQNHHGQTVVLFSNVWPYRLPASDRPQLTIFRPVAGVLS